jgi:hypothetical protein
VRDHAPLPSGNQRTGAASPLAVAFPENGLIEVRRVVSGQLVDRFVAFDFFNGNFNLKFWTSIIPLRLHECSPTSSIL